MIRIISKRGLRWSREYARVLGENDMLRERNLELDRQILEARNIVESTERMNQVLRKRIVELMGGLEEARGICNCKEYDFNPLPETDK